MNAPTPTFAKLNDLDHLAVRRATRKSGSPTYCNDALGIQQHYADDVNGLAAELLVAGHDPKAVAREIERYARNYVDRIGAVHFGIAEEKPDVADRQARFDKWRSNARAKILETLAGPVGQFEPMIEHRDLSILVNDEAGTARILFVDKPEPEVRDALKADGWRWQAELKAWEAPADRVENAQKLLGVGGHASKERARQAAPAARGRS